MKKTTILSLLTIAMILATSVGTYAVWDNITASSKSNTVTLRKPVTIADQTSTKDLVVSSELSSDVTASGSVSFQVANEDSLATKLTLSEKVEAGITVLEENTDYSIAYSGSDVVGKVDSSVTNGEETYNYTITFTESGLSKIISNNYQFAVEVTATLS